MILFGNQQNRSSFNPATVTIGTQVWTLANFAESTLIDGTVIPEVTDNTAWAALTTAAWCNYNNSAANGAIYGKLYNWWAVDLINAAYNPLGWKVPTMAEAETLMTYLGGTSVAGGKMKLAGTTRWLTPNTGADNSSGFTALGSGVRTAAGVFGLQFIASRQWLTNNSGNFAKNIYCTYNNAALTVNSDYLKNSGLPIRLLKI